MKSLTFVLMLGFLLPACPSQKDTGDNPKGDTDTENTGRRVPAEWEDHAATWLQWPGTWERSMRPAFAEIVRITAAYEPVHLIANSEGEVREGQAYLAAQGVPDADITWHDIRVDNAWMRDNGPVYAKVDGALIVLDFAFDAWGGNFGGNIPYVHDDAVPATLADILGLAREDHSYYVLERGNLEFNGADTLVLNWDCQDDRNPSLSKAEHEAILTEALGVDRIIWAYGHDPSDGTTGHIDGYARFINETTIAIGESDWGAETEDALVIACEEAGLGVVRIPSQGNSDYMNWLVGDGFVLGMAFGSPYEALDAAALALLESAFPDREVHLIDGTTLWENGGGVHCVTNDQPEP